MGPPDLPQLKSNSGPILQRHDYHIKWPEKNSLVKDMKYLTYLLDHPLATKVKTKNKTKHKTSFGMVGFRPKTGSQKEEKNVLVPLALHKTRFFASLSKKNTLTKGSVTFWCISKGFKRRAVIYAQLYCQWNHLWDSQSYLLAYDSLACFVTRDLKHGRMCVSQLNQYHGVDLLSHSIGTWEKLSCCNQSTSKNVKQNPAILCSLLLLLKITSNFFMTFQLHPWNFICILSTS